MTPVANDNQHDSLYEVREGLASGYKRHWYVSDPRLGRRYKYNRITICFPTRAQAERARDVLIADDLRVQG